MVQNPNDRLLYLISNVLHSLKTDLHPSHVLKRWWYHRLYAAWRNRLTSPVAAEGMSEWTMIIMHQQSYQLVHHQLTKFFPAFYENRNQECSVKFSISHESLQVQQGLWNFCLCTIFPCSSFPRELWQKNGLLTCVKIRKKLPAAYYQKVGKVNRCLRYQVKTSCAKWKHSFQHGICWLLTVKIQCLTWGI